MPNRFNPNVPPAWHAIRLDETGFYDDAFLARYSIEKIYGVYLTDFNTRTYLCEMTPSYGLYFVKSVYEGGPNVDDQELIEELETKLLEADHYTETISYMHCHAINGLSEDCKVPIIIDKDDWQKEGESGDHEREAAYEAFGSNPAW